MDTQQNQEIAIGTRVVTRFGGGEVIEIETSPIYSEYIRYGVRLDDPGAWVFSKKGLIPFFWKREILSIEG